MTAGRRGTATSRLPWFETEAHETFAGAVTAVSWSPSGGTLAVGLLDGAVRTIPAPGDEGSSTAMHPGGALCLSWSHDGRWLASGGADGRLVVAHHRSGSGLDVELGGWVRAVAWSRQGWLAAAAGRVVQVAHLDDGRWQRLAPHPGTVTALAWSDQCAPGTQPRLAVAGLGGLRWYDPPLAGAPVATRWEGAALLSLALHPAAGVVAAGSLQGRVWTADVRSGPCTRVHGRLGPVRRLAWSEDATRLAAAEESRIAVWDRDRGAIAHPSALVSLSAHAGGVADVAWAPVGGLLASAGADGHVALWRPDVTPDPLQRVNLGEPLSCLAWRADGAGLAVGGEEGSVRLLEQRQRSLRRQPT